MKNKAKIFTSILSEEFDNYINFKRALARKFESEEYALRLFDRYLFENNIIRIKQITPSLINAFLRSRPRPRPRSYNHLLGVIRCLFEWLVSHGRIHHSPVKAYPKKTTSQWRQYILNPYQVAQLIQQASHLSDNSHLILRGEIYPLMFTIMYALGLRVSEVCGLKCSDVDMKRKTIIIRNTKFGKSRIVPFGKKLEKAIRLYIQKRELRCGMPSADAWLLSLSRNQSIPVYSKRLSHTFRYLINKLNLKTQPGTYPPRLHCLRNSFAVHTLLKWYKSGIDPGTRLFQLSTFLGHVSPSSTAWYLNVTEDILKEANFRFEAASCPIFRSI